MTDSLLFPWSGDRLDDSTGAPQNASYFEVYDAGTLDQRDVYTDSDLTDGAAWPITADGGGLCPARYLGVGAYKVIAKKSDGTTLWTLDDLPGALDTSGFGGSGTAAPRTPVSVVALSRSITSADFGKVLSVNPTSGDVILPFPDPAGITNGDGLTVTHTGTANAGVLTFSGQDPYILAEPGEAVRIVCTAAAYLMVSDKSATAPTWYPRITDRLTTAPSSPTTGAYYLINGTPTGTWSTLGFQEHDLVRYDGDGSYILYRPTTDCMWLGTIVDEDLLVQFRGSAWVDLPNVSAPQSDDLDVLSLYYDGTSTNTIAATTWTKVPAYTTAKNTITGASHSAGAITLPVGNYLVLGFPGLVTTTGTTVARARLYSTTNTTTKITSINWKNTVPVSADAGACPVVIGHLAVTSAEVFELQVWSNLSTTIFGAADSSSEAEKFATIEFISIASQQGPIGEQGPQGTDGLDAAHALQWSTSTGDPGTGKIGVNNANPTLATVVNISETGSDSGLLADILATWDDSTSSVRGIIKISKEGSTQHFYYYHLTGAQTNNGTYRSFPATFIGPASGTSLSNGDSCAVLFVPKGDKGDTGATGSAATASFDYTFSTTTTSGPSTGTIRANNATLSSATALYIHETDRLGIPQASAIAQWDDSTTTAHRGYLTLIDVATPANKVRFEITGANTDNGSDQTIVVTYVSGATSLTAVNVQVIWERTGDKGADGAGSGDFVGPASSTDNAIVRFDSTTGKLGKNSGVVIDDSNNVTGVASIAVGDGSVSAPAITNTGDTDTGIYFSAADTVDLATAGVRRLEVSATGTVGINVAAQAASASIVRIDEPSGNTTNDTRVTIANSAGNRAALTQSNASDHITMAMGASGVSTLGNRWGLGMSGSGEYAISVEHGGYPSTYHKNVGVHVNATTALNPLSVGETEATTTSGQMVGIYKAGATYVTLRNTTDNVETIIGATASAGIFGTASAHAILFYVANSALLQFDGSALSPVSSGTVALGTSSLGYSNLFLHTGAVFNWGAGNVTLTHSAATLTLAGATSLAMGTSIAVGLGTIELGHASDTTLSRSSAGVLAVEGVTVALNSTSAAAHIASTIELGHASDTTISRSAAGVIAVEGVPLYSNIPQNSQSAAYTTVLADAQKHILHPSADTTARTITIDSNANVAYPIGTAITFVNQASAGVMTIAITTDTMRLAGAGTTGSRSLAANGIATALKITSTEWIISGTGLT